MKLTDAYLQKLANARAQDYVGRKKFLPAVNRHGHITDRLYPIVIDYDTAGEIARTVSQIAKCILEGTTPTRIPRDEER
jgi:hypothetical protein